MNLTRSLFLVAMAFAVAASVNPAYADDNRYDAKVLVADIEPAPHLDPHLVNPWGIAFNPNGFVWVADNGTGFSTLYDGLGNPQSLVVTIPAAPGSTDHGKPTGIVFNTGGGFAVSIPGKNPGNSAFLFATEDGLIAGWAPSVDLTHAIQGYPKAGDPPSGAVYKGLAIATSAVGNTIYAADFLGGKIDVFNSTFTKVSLAGDFSDPDLQKDFSPFNIQNINGNLFVMYAKREEGEDEEITGPSLGIVNEFDANGHLLRRFATRGRLNAPWGIALAPATFGAFANDILIGNFGDGAINAYDAATGEFKGRLRGTDHRELRLDGLWGMAFGNDLNNQPKSTLFFAAGPDDETHGIYGSIAPAP
ncbi:MAG TPA: TIGR03118 family protein [Casimicrobiaceae bacterium]|jgi:uncharacterized protein (TIGR03118 family)